MGDYRDSIYAAYRSGRLATPFPNPETEFERRIHYFRRMIRDLVPADRTIRITDLGCGSGVLLRSLAESGYRALTGVDVSAEQSALAKVIPGVKVYTKDVRDFLQTAPDSDFDVVIAFDLLEHFTREELLGMLRNIHRILRAGGKLIGHVPNGEAFFGARSFFWDATHQTGWTRASCGQLVGAAGFTKFRAYEDTPAIHGVLSLGRAVLWRIIRACCRFALAVETGDASREAIFSQNMLFVCTRD